MLLFLPGLPAQDRPLNIFDQQVSFRIQGSNQFPLRDYFFESYALLTPMLEIAPILEMDGPRFQATVTALAATQVVSIGLKYLIGRERPRRNYQPRLWNSRLTPSFPSGHTASSAAFATSVGLTYPEMALPMAGLALLSGYSQLYVGNHYFSDVLAGFVLGSLVGYLTYQSMEENTGAEFDQPGLRRISMKLFIPL